MVHGIWVFSDPSSSSSTEEKRKTAEITVQIMVECAGISEASKQAAALEHNNGLSGGSESLDRGRTSVRLADLQPHEHLGNQSPSQSTTPSSLTELFWKALVQYRGRGGA